jgi:hypothetical protein
LVRSFFDLRRATQDVERAQGDLNRVTQEYAAQIDPLSAEIDAINDQQQAIDDQLRLRDLQDDLASGKLDDLETQKALLDIQEIQKRAELRGIEENRDAAVDAAEARLNAAEEAQLAAQDRLADEQAAAQSLTHQNELIGQQTALLERMQQQAEAAAKAKAGGGGGGGAGPIAIPSPEPPDITPVTGVLDELETQVADTQNQVELFFTGLSETIETAIAPAIEVLQPLISIFEDSRTPVEGLLNVLSEVSPTFELLRGIVEAALPPIQSIVESVFGIVAGLIQNHGDEMLASVSAVWTQIDILIQTLLPPIQSIVETVFGAVAAFLAENSDEIESFIATSWEQIASIVQTAVAIVNAIIVPAFQTIAAFLQQHSDDIQHILSSAWDTISGIISGALSLIQGLLTTIMLAIQGDWQGAWDTLQATSAQFVTDVLAVVTSFLDTIAGFFGTSMDDLATLWASNWDKIGQLAQTAIDGLVTIITGMPAMISGVGESVVMMIWDGIKAKWDELVDWFDEQLAKLTDKLPFSEPKDTSSPLYGLARAGESIINQILIGLVGRGPALADQMAAIGEVGVLGLIEAMDEGMPAFQSALDGIVEAMRQSVADAEPDVVAQMEDTIDAIVAAAARLPDLIADATAGMFDVQADVARLADRNLTQLADFAGQQQETIRSALAQAELEAGKIADPEEAAAFFALRSKQIFELAKLEREANEAGGAQLKQIQDQHTKALDDLTARQGRVESDLDKVAARENAQLTDLYAKLGAATTDDERAAIQAKIDETRALAEEERERLFAELRLIDQARQAEQTRFAQAVAQNETLAAEERARYAQRIILITEAQEAELAALKTRQANEKSALEELAKTAAAVLGAIPQQLIPPGWLDDIKAFEELLRRLGLSGLDLPVYIPQPDPIGGNGFLGSGGIGSMGTLNAPGLGALSAGGMGGGAIDIAVNLSVNSGGLSWLERFVDTRIEAKTARAAGGADVRRRAR